MAEASAVCLDTLECRQLSSHSEAGDIRLQETEDFLAMTKKLERARKGLEEDRAREGSFGKILARKESCYTTWSPIYYTDIWHLYHHSCLGLLEKASRLSSASRSPFAHSSSGCKELET